MQVIFSSGKSVASIALAILVDRGLLEYELKISHYWPEFGKNGKENTVRTLNFFHRPTISPLRYYCRTTHETRRRIT